MPDIENDEGALDFASALSQFMGGEEPTPVTRTEIPPEEPAEAPQDAAAELEAAAQAQEGTPSPEALVEPESTPPAPAPENDKSWARLMARESAFLEERQRFQQEKAQYEERLANIKDSSEWKEDLAIHPVQFLREYLGDSYDLSELAQDLWFEAKGAEAPANYRATKEARTARLEAIRTRREIGKARQHTVQSQPVQQGNNLMLEYAEGLRSYAKAAPTDSNPLVAKFVKTHGDQRAMEAMFAHAQRIARESRGERVLSPAEAAAELEKELQQLKGLFVDESATQPGATNAAPQSQTTPSTLRNQHQTTQGDKEAEDELSDEFLRRKAFEAMGRPDLIGKI